jgi:hypothetical protein
LTDLEGVAIDEQRGTFSFENLVLQRSPLNRSPVSSLPADL